MPQLMSSQFGSDVRKQWMCARVISLRYYRASARAIERALGEWDDGNWSVSFMEVPPGSPQVTLCEKPGYVLAAIGGVPSVSVARAFVTGYGNPTQANPVPHVNPVAILLADTVASVVLTILRRNPGQGTIAGWSMGGVMAAYVASFLTSEEQAQQFECITFGSPRFGGPSFNDLCATATYRVFNRDDPIPFLPVWSTEEASTYWVFRALYPSSEANLWRHSGEGWKLDENSRTVATMPNFPAAGIGNSMVGWAVGIMTDPVLEHAIATYEARLFALALPRLPDLLPIEQDAAIPALRVPLEPAPELPAIPNFIQRLPVPERQVSPPPPIPLAVSASKPFYAARLNGKGKRNPEWWVWHWETPMFRTKDRSKAKRAASRLNSLALAWSESTAGEQFDLIDAIQIEFPAE